MYTVYIAVSGTVIGDGNYLWFCGFRLWFSLCLWLRPSLWLPLSLWLCPSLWLRLSLWFRPSLRLLTAELI